MSTATTPVELVTVGRVPARERGLFTGVAPSVVEVFPSVFLIASIVRTKNQCILELVQPAGKSAAATNTTTVSPALNSFKTNSSRVSPSSSSLPEVQRRLCEADGVPRGPTHPTSVAVPFALKAGFRVPRVIHLVAEDEGVIETVTLVRDPLGAAFVAALEEEDRATSVNPLRDTAAAGAASSIPSVHLVHIHFFIGTSNGTVIVGNALRGTILAVAQFQYHHLFSREARGGRSTTTSTAPLDGGTSDGEAEGAQGDSKRSLNNQAVVKFVVREKREEQLWNPSLPFSQENNIFVSQDGSVLSKKAAAADAASPTVGSRVASVYVVHSGGKVVELTRAALDAFVRSSVDRLDGRRPHLILEWDADTSASSFPVAGPASDFAAHIGHVFVLEPPSSNSPIEEHTATSKSASPQSTLFSIRDADILTEMPEATALLAPLEAQRRPFESLLIGGSSPLFSFYRLQPHSSGFSASNAVKAVKNMVTGVARTLWFSALGTTSPIERPPHLKKIPTPDTRRFLQADAKCVALQIDPSQQYAVFAVEGGGRIYVAEVQTGVISGVLKGCRAAQFTWWWVDSAAGRPALLLIVYLPLRRAVEVYTPRTWERLAACHVPEGCVLLRTCGVPRERCDDAGASRGLLSGGKLAPSVCSGCGSDALLMDPAGTVYAIRVGWVLKDIVGNASFLQPMPSLSAGEATTTSTSASDEAALLSSSVLRACQTPDDFVELALQLPLPQPRVVWEDSVAPTSPAEDGSSSGDTAAVVKAYAVKGGDEVRQYSKSLELLCHTVQRRFAPGYAEIFVAAMPCTPQLVLEGSAAAVPHNMTAAQCLHYVRTYRSLTENYYRLLSCRRVAPSRYFDPAQWTSGLITPELWKETFSTADSAATVAFVRHMEERMEALLAAFPAELHVFKKYFAAHLYQVLRKVPSLTTAAASATPCALADPASFMPLATFLHCFYCGTTRPSFLCDAIEAAEDADGSINFLGPFSDLAFGKLGLNSFFAQLPVLTELGCTDGDVAVLTVTWISRQGGRNLCSLLSSTTVGLLVAILLSFSDGDFLFALDRAPIPFISVDGDIATNTAANSITSLLWCCAVRCALRPSTSFITGQHFTRRVRQLLQLWYSLTKGVAPPAAASAPASDPISSPCTDARIAFSLRLGSVEPPSLPLTSTASVAASAADSSGLRSRAVQTEGDAFEVYLQRNGISVSLLDDYVIPRADADAEAVRNLPLFYTFISSLGATENVRSRSSGACDSPDVVESLPWIDSHKWDQERFRNDVTKPLENLWLQLTSSATGKSKSRSLKTTLRGAAADDESRQSVYTSCLLLVAMSVLEHATRPLTDVAFFFWDNNAIPDGNLFPVDGAPEGLILFGSRTSREYLKSVQKLAALIESMLQQAVAPLGNADRVRLIQQINMALSEDDALLFPLVPSFLRTRLTILMQVLAQAPHAPLRRVQRVSRLVSLLLFFSEASALTMGGVALTQLQSQMAVPWKELIGGANRRDQLRLLPDVFIAEVNLPSPSQPALAQGAGLALSAYAMEDEQPTSAPLDVGVAVAVMRRFLVAGSVLYGQQRGNLPSPSSAPAAAAAVFTPTPYLGLVADDTRQCLTRLAHCLGLHEAWSDVADIVLMDYEIKHLFPVAAIEQEMLLLSTKSAAPRIGVSLLQCYLVQVLQHVTTQRKGHRQRGDRAAFEVSSDNLRRLVDALSAESRAWLQQRETEMMAADTEGKAAGTEMSHTRLSSPGSSTGVIASADSLPMGDAGWVTVTEFEDMRRLVLSTLGLPKGTPERKNFFQVLFTLSQWACEGRLTLPAPLQRIARELPQVVEKWEKIV